MIRLIYKKMAEYRMPFILFSKNSIWFICYFIASVYYLDIEFMVGELLVQFTNLLFLHTLFNAFREHLFVIIYWSTGSCRSHGVINLVLAHLCHGIMIEHVVILGTHSFNTHWLLVNYAKELIRHLEEDRNCTFLEVKINDVKFSVDLLFWIRRARLKCLSWRILVLSGWRTTLLLLLNIWGTLYELIDINVKLEELLPNEIFDELIIVNQFLIIHLGSTFEFHLLGIILPFNFDFSEGVTYQFQHFVRITLEFHAHMEWVGLHLLRNQADLIIPFVTERVFRIFMCW